MYRLPNDLEKTQTRTLSSTKQPSRARKAAIATRLSLRDRNPIGGRHASRTGAQNRACFTRIALLRCCLSTNSEGEARPRARDDDEPLHDAWRLLATRIPRAVFTPQPDRLRGVVELRARQYHGSASVSWFHRSQRTDRF